MGINKVGNYKYNGNIPEMGGDIYRGQDMIRDFWYHQDKIGTLLKDINIVIPVIISGGVVSKGTGDTLNITPCVGYHKYQVEIPGSWEASPPTKINADIEAVRVNSVQQTNMAIPSAILNGSTINYVKLAFSFASGNTRQRAIKQSSYNYELIPSYSFVVDSIAPTEYEICLASFTGTSGGTFTFGSVNKSDVFNPLVTTIDTQTLSNKTIDAKCKVNPRANYNGHLHGDNITHQTIFNTLSPFIPTVGDTMIIYGRWGNASGQVVNSVSRAVRNATGEITFYCVNEKSYYANTSIIFSDDTLIKLFVSLAW